MERHILKAAVVVIAAVAIVYGVTRLHEQRRCQVAHGALLVALFHHRQPAGGRADQLRTLTSQCHDPAPVAQISILLATAGYRADAIATARRAIHLQPNSTLGWTALAEVLARSDPRGAAAARARVLALNPQAVVPSLPAATRGRPTT